mgnify:CR=1 FL=1
MTEKNFGVKKLDIIGSGTPTIESPSGGDLNITAATSTFSGNVTLPDNKKLRLGNTAGDFDIYYDDNAYLKTGSKGFNIQSYNGHFRISTGANDDLKFAFSVVGIVCADDFIPEANGTRDLGLTGMKWKDAYLSGTVNANTFSGSGASLTGIANANISNSAAIAGTKISPDFGTQNVTTTGTLGSGDLTITGTQPALNFIDDGQNPDFKLYNNNGILKLFDTTNSNDYVVVQPIISGSRQDLQVGIFTDFNGGSSTYRAGTFGNVLEIFGGGASSEGALRIGANSGATNNSTGIIQFFDNTLDTANVAHIAAYKVPHNSTSTNRGADLVFRTKVDQGSLTEKLRITDDGNVGIGTDFFPQLVVDSGNTAILAVGIVTAHQVYADTFTGNAATATTASNVTVRTDSGNANHNVVFVDSTTDNQNQVLKMDDENNRLQWNPSSELLLAYRLQSTDYIRSSQIRTNGGSYGTAGQVLTSQGFGNDWTWETPSSGNIVPAIETTQTTGNSTSSSTFQISMTINITPTTSGSDLLVIAGGTLKGDFIAEQTDEGDSASFIEAQLFRGNTALGTSCQPGTSKNAQGFYLAFKDTASNHQGSQVTYHLKFRRMSTNDMANDVEIIRGSSMMVQEII